jgi:hypothetical protein
MSVTPLRRNAYRGESLAHSKTAITTRCERCQLSYKPWRGKLQNLNVDHSSKHAARRDFSKVMMLGHTL